MLWLVPLSVSYIYIDHVYVYQYIHMFVPVVYFDTRMFQLWMINQHLHQNEVIYWKKPRSHQTHLDCILRRRKTWDDKGNHDILFNKYPTRDIWLHLTKHPTALLIWVWWFLRTMSTLNFSFHLNTSEVHERHGRLMKGVFYQHSAYGFCLIPEMLCNLEPMLSNTSLATDTVVYGLRRLS